MIIIGVDPGLCHTGWGVIEILPQGYFRVLGFDTISPPQKIVLEQRFLFLKNKLTEVFQIFHPVCAAIEDVFLAQKGVMNTFKLNKTHGIIMVTCAEYDIPVTGYTPAHIKKNITGYGRATKEQIHYMVKQSLSLQANALRATHEADALAVALVHAYAEKARQRLI